MIKISSEHIDLNEKCIEKVKNKLEAEAKKKADSIRKY